MWETVRVCFYVVFRHVVLRWFDTCGRRVEWTYCFDTLARHVRPTGVFDVLFVGCNYLFDGIRPVLAACAEL